MGIIVMGSIWGGSMGKVGALELVGRYEGVAGCIGGVKLNSILRSKLAAKVGWVKGPQAKNMHPGWVERPWAEGMCARWVQGSQY